ncbi:MAG: hypothetical protein ABEH59_02500 [Halobacteriales archaeon]
MNSSRSKLFVLLAIVGAIGLVTATGAFGSVTAQRTADVSVAGDDAALIGLEAGSGGGVSDYVTGTDEITIDLSNVNTNATTAVPNALNITNRGSQEVAIQITRTGSNSGAIAFAVQESELSGTPPTTPDLQWPDTVAHQVDDGGTPIDLDPGESVQVGIYVDTSDVDVTNGLTPGPNALGASAEIITSVTINADASDADGDDGSDTGSNLDS